MTPPITSERFTSPLHSQRVASVLGLALGLSFLVCFVTGLLSHLIQQPPGWFAWPARPAGLYRVTQGVHVATGIASVPLLLVKLWAVYPHFWTWPPVRSAAHAVERVSLLPLVGGSLFMLATGVANIARWYPFGFNFTAAHYAVAWITIGALVTHVAAKAAIVGAVLARNAPTEPDEREGALTRRQLLGAAAAGSGLLTVATLGQTVRPLDRLSVLSPRRPGVGPQGLPVNKTASGARVVEAALSSAYRLVVDGRVAQALALTLDDLRALPQHEADLPIACVEGWSASARWRGVRVRDLLALASAREGARARVHSLQQGRFYTRSNLDRSHASDPDTLLALELNGEPLHLDHGFPVRLIGPNRPGVLQTKWVHRLEAR